MKRVVAVLLVAFAAPCLAQVHKCVDAEGHVTYQDEPCPAGTAVPAPVIAPPPAYAPPPPAAPTSTRTARDEEDYVEPAPYVPLPELYRCTRYDDQESYVSSDPTPRVYQVPTWAVLPDMTTSGAGGLSTSRGGDVPAELLATYTTVADTCRPMPRAELCRYWDERRETVRAAARIAFNDTRPALEQEAAGLREQLDAHCR